VVTKWYDPIKEHDEAVKDVEEKMEISKALARVYAVESRTQKNWDAAWLLMNDRPEELSEYNELKKKNNLTGNFEKDKETYNEYYEGLKDARIKVEAEEEWKRFCTLKPKCERLIKMQIALHEVRETKTIAFENSRKSDKDLEKAKDVEKAAAAKISADHVIADEQRVGVAELFPTVQVGYIVTNVNGFECENKPFEEIHNLVFENLPPHTLQFRRYDYRRDMAKGNWWSLEELRQQNKFVEDPRLVRSFFTNTCRVGNNDEIEMRLKRGADINSYDAATHQTGLHFAASNAHIDTMRLLLKYGADLEARDNNQETPFLLAARTGHVEACRFLLQEARASAKVSDRMGRTALTHAIKSMNMDIVELVIEFCPNMASTDKEWGWTPLHFAAASGSVEMCAMVLERGASVYAYSKKGNSTPLMVAEQNEHELVIQFLKEYIYSQPAQNITPEAKVAIWLGKKDAAFPVFATDRGFRGILSICDNGVRAKKTLWLDDEEDVWHKCVMVPKKEPKRVSRRSRESKGKEVIGAAQVGVAALEVKEEKKLEKGGAGEEGDESDFEEDMFVDDDSGGDWDTLCTFLKDSLAFIDDCIENGRNILVHDDEGSNFATALLVIWMCTRKRVRTKEAVKYLAGIRREAVLSKGMLRAVKKFQETLDTKKLKRLEQRLRNSDVVSIGF
jgi:ankyrin repeat protein